MMQKGYKAKYECSITAPYCQAFAGLTTCVRLLGFHCTCNAEVENESNLVKELLKENEKLRGKVKKFQVEKEELLKENEKLHEQVKKFPVKKEIEGIKLKGNEKF